jgi:hypothetical protein
MKATEGKFQFLGGVEMAEGKRFEVQIALLVKELKDGQPTDFFDNTLTYHDIGYDGVVMVEQTMVEALNKLSDVGIIQAQAMGLGDRLSALGLGPKVQSLGVK